MITFQFNTTNDLFKVKENGQKILLKDIFAAFSPTPFANGHFRECFMGIILNKKKQVVRTNDFPLGKCVVKKSKNKNILVEDIKDFFSSFIACNYAIQFNNIIKIPNKINFVNPYMTFDKVTKQFAYVEPFLDGEYIRFSNNTGYENPNFNAFIPAFSHYTWVASKGQLVVLDVQGTFVNKKYYLTDPAVQTVNMACGQSDLGACGIMKFLLFHKHNDICKNWKWVPNQLNMYLKCCNATSVARTYFRFEIEKIKEKYTPIYLQLLKYIFN